VSGVVVPLRVREGLDLTAVHFALEYAKRSRARLLFLLVEEPFPEPSAAGSGETGASARRPGPVRRTLQALLEKESARRTLEAEICERRGHFLEELRRFVRERHGDEIVISRPGESRETEEDLQMLAQLTRCRILTVKPKTSSN